MNLDDPRIAIVTKSLGGKDVSDICQGDFDQLEDNFITMANEVLPSEETLAKLLEAGFDELAEQLTALNDASQAYDWSRENL